MNVNSNTGRRRAQRLVDAINCEKCGSTEKLERHHKDGNPMNNEPNNLAVLCSPCHHKEHLRIAPATCVVCGQMFRPKRARRATLCGSLNCSKEHGKRSAALRWE
jgi:transcription elongation factor Elf1